MRYLVVGQGITAKSVVAHCERQAVPCAQIDTLDALASVDRAQFDCLVISPGLDRRHTAIQALLEAGVPVIGDIELFMQSFTGKIIAVTGSNGKSTTVSMVDHVLRASGYHSALGGNIGLAALDLLIDPPEIAVLELSSFQLESTPSMHSSVATVLNVTEDHLDRYSGMDDYAQTKRHIYRQSDHVISNADDALTQTGGLMRAVPVARILERKSIWLGADRWS
ncbi:MAG: UDP-N-acetylmuramoyl-L-alanine--D-glutamate ligase, partial [Gammaproteobacteria bacterium]|nr:UDP-N-acetylmuramoyl-L-alanine--D-glutamate ligase [Gammaproteobacteria bacterium]